MRETQKYVVISFHTTTAAFATEKYCKARGIPGRMISVPREMSAGCGIAWRMLPEDFRSHAPSAPEAEGFSALALCWREALEALGVEVEEIAEITR